MAAKPTVVFSIGAWLTPPAFSTIQAKLAERGIPSEVPAHPSIGAEPPNKTLYDDVASFKAVLTQLVGGQGKDVIVVGHSYGGVVASCAVEGLAKASRKAAGQEGGVIRIMYMAAFALDKGQSLLDMLGGQYLPWMDVQGDYVRVIRGVEVALHDAPVEIQQKAESELVHTSRAVFSGPATYEPWHDIPPAYIITEDDRGLPLQFQELLSAKLGTEVIYRIKSSHSPFLSMPDRLAEILEEVAGKSQ
ncbi:Alpha/beta hydrolase fold-1 [Aspergillus aurantiobrunneus]